MWTLSFKKMLLNHCLWLCPSFIWQEMPQKIVGRNLRDAFIINIDPDDYNQDDKKIFEALYGCHLCVSSPLNGVLLTITSTLQHTGLPPPSSTKHILDCPLHPPQSILCQLGTTIISCHKLLLFATAFPIATPNWTHTGNMWKMQLGL